ncbi:MAG: hypothetical protein K2O91_00165 [Lachnospiraceae bacterium]|nr:hypothetical protein [Lachnospiraceae bacterium]
MDFMNEKGAARIVNVYIDREIAEYRKVTEKELRTGGITPEAKAAFSRKPYYGASTINIKNRPVLR